MSQRKVYANMALVKDEIERYSSRCANGLADRVHNLTSFVRAGEVNDGRLKYNKFIKYKCMYI